MTKKELGNLLTLNLESYLKKITVINKMLSYTLMSMVPNSIKGLTQTSDFVKAKGKIIKDDKGKEHLRFKIEDARIYESLAKQDELSFLSMYILPQSLFLSLISNFDEFIGMLIRITYKIKPEILNSSEKNISFSKLMEFESLDHAREFIIEKEVESVLRESHINHFEYLERKLNIKLRVNLPIWSDFVEYTQRRNLISHTGGKVSSQYLKICTSEKVKLEDNLKVGHQLVITPNYVEDCFYCLYELGTKLTHSIWRKFLNEDLENADSSLNQIAYNLLLDSENRLANIISEFGYSQKKHYNNFSKTIFLINLALSYYLNNDKEQAVKLLDEHDWSISDDEFKLAYFVIKEDYSKVYDLMKKIGDNGNLMTKVSYKVFPLFKKIQNQESFKNAFEEIFNEQLLIEEGPISIYEQTMVENYDKLNSALSILNLQQEEE